MSGAQASGTTKNAHVQAEEITDEERQKRELAQALFGGMQSSAVDDNLLREQQSLSSNDRSLAGRSAQKKVLNGRQLIDLGQQEQANSKLDLNSGIDHLLPSSSDPMFDPDNSKLLKHSPHTNPDETGLGLDRNSKIEPSTAPRTSIYDDFKQDLKSSLDDEMPNQERVINSNHQTRDLLVDGDVNHTTKTESSRDHDLLGTNHGAPEIASGQDLLSLDETRPSTLLSSSKESAGASTQNQIPSLLDADDETDILEQPISKAFMPPTLDQFPHTKDHIELCGDGVVRVTMCKVWKPDALGLVFFVHNEGRTNRVEDFAMKLQLPSNFKVRVCE